MGDAKLRHNFCVCTSLNNRNEDIITGLTFVNNLMRNMYDLAQKYMGDDKCRHIIDDKINGLAKEWGRIMNRQNKKRNDKYVGS